MHENQTTPIPTRLAEEGKQEDRKDAGQAMKNRKRIHPYAVAATLGLLAACGDQAEVGSVPEPQEATVTIAGSLAILSEQEFEQFVVQPVAAKYPHITVKRVTNAGAGLNELVTAKETPDIVLEGVLNLPPFLGLRLDANVEDLIKRHHLDLNRIQPAFLEAIQVGSDRQHLIGLPIHNQAFALFYNKTLFDRFAVPYPSDGMTWEQVRELAVRLTRHVDGVQYYGLYADRVFRGAYQLGLPWIDFEQKRAALQTEEWKQLFVLWHSLFQAPGFAPKGTNYSKLFNEGKIAMMSGSSSTLADLAKLPDMDWDLVTYPQNTKAPGVGQRVNGFGMFITSTSANKDAAFQVIATVLSDEVQADMSRHTRMSVLKSRSVQEQFGQGSAALRAKNVIALTKPKLAPMVSLGNLPLTGPVNNALESMLYDGKDVNTALREADEQINLAIKQAIAANPNWPK